MLLRPLTAVAPLSAELGLQGFSSYGAPALVVRSLWGLPRPGSSHNNNSSHPQVPTLHQALVLKAVLGASIQLSLQPSELVLLFLFDKAGSWGSAIQQLVQGHMTVGPELGWEM